VAVLGLLTACGRAEAPRDWAANRGLDAGGTVPDRPAIDPQNVVPHAERPNPGTDRTWMLVVTVVLGLVGIALGAGVWAPEARRQPMSASVIDDLTVVAAQRVAH